MTTIKELHEVMVTEAQLTEGLATVLQQQQEAIINSKADDLNALLEKSEELLQPITALEVERARLAETIVSDAHVQTPSGVVTSADLLNCLDGKDALLIKSAVQRLRTASQEVLRLNTLNTPLLEHSSRFVRQTLRAATDDYKKNLIDKRM